MHQTRDQIDAQATATGGQGQDPGAAGVPASATPDGQVQAELSTRIIAGLIDTGLAIVVGFIPFIGGLAATAYWLVRDGLEVEGLRHRSVGKKLMGLRPVRLDGASMDLATSARRNWPFAFGGVVQILMFIPFVGWLLMIPVALVALVVGITEIVLILSGGRRLGDRTAGTRVVKA